MKTLLHQWLGRACPLFFLLVAFSASSQVNLAAWTFDNLEPNPNTATSLAANFGPQTGTAYMYLDGTHGSSSWNNNQRGRGNGTVHNDPRNTPIAGESYRINPNANLGGNGKSIVWTFDMTGYENPIFTFALFGTPLSFTHQWAWSTDGVTFTNFGPNTQNMGGNWQLRNLDMSAIDQLDNSPTVFIRLTVDNAVDNTGRNRFDNMVISASEQQPKFGSIAQDATSCSGLPTQFNVTGLLPNSTSTIYYDIDSGATLSVSDVQSDASGNSSFNIILAASDHGKTLTVTSVERTDHPAGPSSVVANNTVILNVTASVTYYADEDSDGFGDADNFVYSCDGLPTGHVLNDDDCDDADDAVNPNAAEIFFNGIDDNCDGTIDEGQQLTTSIKANQCGGTLARIYSAINASVAHPDITAYRFEVTNLNTNAVQVIESITNWFQLTDLADYQYGTTYAIRIELQRLEVWLGYYGPACSITTPSLFTGPVALSIPECGTTLPFRYSPIFMTGPNFISSYNIRVTNITNPLHPFAVQTLTRTVPWFTLKMLPSYDYSTTYAIEVQCSTTGEYSSFTSPCNVTTPAAPSVAPNSSVPLTAGSRAVSFPNPYTESFTLHLGRDVRSTVAVRVYDMLGNLRESATVQGSDLANYQLGKDFISGVYNVVVQDGETIESVRVIKR